MTARVECRTVKRYFAQRVVLARACGPNCDGCHRCESDNPETVQRRSFASESAAWRWVARAALFRARDSRCKCQWNIDNYKGSPAWDGGPEQCDLCTYPLRLQQAVARLARILQSRSRKSAP